MHAEHVASAETTRTISRGPLPPTRLSGTLPVSDLRTSVLSTNGSVDVHEVLVASCVVRWIHARDTPLFLGAGGGAVFVAVAMLQAWRIKCESASSERSTAYGAFVEPFSHTGCYVSTAFSVFVLDLM
jgi:hypothetical protein